MVEVVTLTKTRQTAVTNNTLLTSIIGEALRQRVLGLLRVRVIASAVAAAVVATSANRLGGRGATAVRRAF